MRGNHYTLITGASQGLGKYLALEGAQRGWDLVLVALPGSGLPELAGYITKHWNSRVVVMEKDLSAENACHQLFYELKEKGILINRLINNAGMGGNYAFDEKGTEYFSRQIHLNVTVPTVLTRLLLDDLRKTAPSAILNVGSLACFFKLPTKQVYASTKSYLLHFSCNLRKEVKQNGISVSVVCPGGMDTRWQLIMEHRLEKNWLKRHSIMHPAEVSRVALNGMERGKAVIVPGFINKCFLFFSRIFPNRLVSYLTRQHVNKLKPVWTAPVSGIEKAGAVAV